MRRSLFFCGVVVALLSTVNSTRGQTEYEVAHQKEEAERRATVAANLPLLDSEAEAFWDLYLEYRATDKEMDDRRANLMSRFAESYKDLAEDEGNRLVTDASRLEEQCQSLKKRFFEKFGRIHSIPLLVRHDLLAVEVCGQRYGYAGSGDEPDDRAAE